MAPADFSYQIFGSQCIGAFIVGSSEGLSEVSWVIGNAFLVSLTFAARIGTHVL